MCLSVLFLYITLTNTSLIKKKHLFYIENRSKTLESILLTETLKHLSCISSLVYTILKRWITILFEDIWNGDTGFLDSQWNLTHFYIFLISNQTCPIWVINTTNEIFNSFFSIFILPYSKHLHIHLLSDHLNNLEK